MFDLDDTLVFDPEELPHEIAPGCERVIRAPRECTPLSTNQMAHTPLVQGPLAPFDPGPWSQAHLGNPNFWSLDLYNLLDFSPLWLFAHPPPRGRGGGANAFQSSGRG